MSMTDAADQKAVEEALFAELGGVEVDYEEPARIAISALAARGVSREACDRCDLPAVALVMVEKVREAARKCGWAIGVHGSLTRDIDLIAVPWVEHAADAHSLVLAIRLATGYVRPGTTGKRPHNRQSVLLVHHDAVSDQELFNEGKAASVHPKGTWYPAAIDLSIVDSRDAALAEIARLRAALEEIGIRTTRIADMTTGGPATHQFIAAVEQIAREALEGKGAK